MKKILCGTVAAIALVGLAAPAAARTNERHYAGTGSVNLPIIGPVNISGGITNPNALLALGLDIAVQNSTTVGTRYTVEANAPNDRGTATPSVSVKFAMTGTVNKDCSFYSGNGYADNVRNIDLGTIGVKVGDNENVNQAFEMAGDVEVEVETLTAGCNFNNKVEIVKNDVNGLVNTAPGGYDTTRFQANIPYSVKARWFGVAQGAPTGGSNQSLTVSETQLSNNLLQGAWRSNMNIDIFAPAISSKGLVAGTYTGTTTLTLTAS